MPTTLLLVRHGQTDANASRLFQGRVNYPLNVEGITQIQQTTKILQELNFSYDAFFCSPLLRTQMSAKILNYLNKEIIFSDNIVERDFGDCEGLPITDENYRKLIMNQFKNQETEQMIIERAQAFLSEILKNYQNKKVLIVSHSHLIKAILKPYMFDLSFDQSIKNGCSCILLIDGDKYTVGFNLIEAKDYEKFIS